MFAVLRALAVSLAIAIAFGLELPNAYWMPIATLVAMKASLEQSALAAEQRLAGATVGATFATLVLLTIDGTHVLEAIIVLLAALGAALRTVNYALYCATIAALVLIADDLAHPTNFSNEIERRVVHARRLGDRGHRHVPCRPALQKTSRHRCSSSNLNLPGPARKGSSRRTVAGFRNRR